MLPYHQYCAPQATAPPAIGLFSKVLGGGSEAGCRQTIARYGVAPSFRIFFLASRNSRNETRRTLMTGARLKHYGWGREGEGMSAEERTFVLGRYHAKFATDEFETIAVPELNDLSLREPRVVPPASLAGFCTTDRYDRAAHTYGKSYPDYVRAMLGDYNCAPDDVAYPRNEEEISAVMEWANSVGASMTPFGGGSSVCGGVEPHVDGIKHKAAVTLDLRNLSKVVEVDPVSVPHRSKPAPMARLWKTSSSHMASRCDISRRVLNTRRSAVGLQRIRRPFRQSSYPHRRLRRKPACRDASWRAGDAPTSRIGCEAHSRPHVHRFGRNPWA